MAVPSNRSPSPHSSRPNPHSGNSESNSTIRRSFGSNPHPRPSVLTNPRSFNPVTPANSPAGFGRRNSVGKEGMGRLQSCDEKENDKHQVLNPVKVRSPANGSKNFMSPTISAASKFTPSPRKKPLVDRNEPIRTSISLSDGKATFFSATSSENTQNLVPKSELLVDQKMGGDCLESTAAHLDQKEAVLECPPASKIMKRVTFAELPSDSENASGLRSDKASTDSGSLNVESDPNKPSCFAVSPVIAPLDADPSIPPYDPKTNYLSPRPQFLHYKPNPRIEVLLHNKENGLDSEVKRLDDSFIVQSLSETFLDADATEEPKSEDSQKDSEESSSAETEEPEVKEEELNLSESSLFSTINTHETSEEEELCVTEKIDISTPISIEIPEDNVGGEVREKKRFFTSLKLFSVLLVFLVVVIPISITNYPVLDETLKFSELRLQSRVADTTKANFDAFVGRFKQLPFDSISHLSMLLNNLGKHDTLSPLQFINLTDLENDFLVGANLHASESLPIGPTANEVSENVSGGKVSEKLTGDFEKEDEEDGESLPLEEETYIGGVSDDISETESDREIVLGTREFISNSAPGSQVIEAESLETVWSQEGVASDTDTEVKYKKNIEDYIDPASEALEIQPDEATPKIQPELLETRKPEVATGLASEAIEVKSEENAPEIQTELLQTTTMEAAIGIEVKSEEKAPEIQTELLETTTAEAAIGSGFEARVEPSSVVDINLESTSDVTGLSDEHRQSEIVESAIGGSQNMLSAHYIVPGVISIALALISAAAYYLERGTTSEPNPAVHTDQLLSKKIPASSVLEQQIHQERLSSQNWPTEVDVMGESCPSEMSSFQTISSHSMLRSATEAHSQERKPRKHSKRESLASSSECSMDSPSYGSFTTYEKIQIKHASGDAEIMTPVRRSSRIRNLVTSP